MAFPIIEIYSSLECPYAYLATYRLRQLWPEYAGRVRLVWRALSLEYINQQSVSKPTHDAELGFFPQIEPALPLQAWTRPTWEWPVTMWPAFEALACAQAQGDEAALAMSWALRYAFFAQGRSLSLRHELLAIAADVAATAGLDVTRFEDDWDHGRYKGTVIAESQRGWHDLKLNGSATFVLPDGRQVTNPALGQVDFDEANNILRSYMPYAGDPLALYREMLESVSGEMNYSGAE
jgi:predicted DsbA family dithiol-disulfide isomerase